MDIKRTDEHAILITGVTLRLEEPGSASDDGAASQSLVKQIPSKDHVRFLVSAARPVGQGARRPARDGGTRRRG